MKSYKIIGLMSGTSLDGLDIAYVEFKNSSNQKWNYQLLECDTVSYSKELFEKLVSAHQLTSFQLFSLDKELGEFYSACVLKFISSNKIDSLEIDAIASHGQTIFHQPDKGITVQIGCGTSLASHTGIKVINDFRKKDLVFGGQGAPLVPIGDFSLFQNEAESFLNIGGFSNISFKKDGVITAFDICPGNLPLNKLANSKGLAYDKNGDLAKNGEINFFLLDLLNELEYYKENYPKSLGSEWLETEFYRLIKFDRDIENNLRTLIEHIAYQISFILNENNLKSVFISGGGALNPFLIERIEHYYKGKIIIPEKDTIEFKEAIIFAFLGALFLENKPNCLSSVTGARKDVVGGTLHLP
jgi:anhydro-N-acetylmuramic acid kinase